MTISCLWEMLNLLIAIDGSTFNPIFFRYVFWIGISNVLFYSYENGTRSRDFYMASGFVFVN